MILRWAACAALTALIAHAPAPAGRQAQRETPLTVSAAISLTDSLEAIAGAYAAAGGGEVRFNFAGSNVLARQIVSGAPVDLFISADDTQMDVAAHAGAIDAGTRLDLLGNRLAVIARPDRIRLDDARALLGPGIRRIAIGDPSAVPAGVYARQFLRAAGLWDVLQPKLVPVANARAAIAAVENASVEAAIAYETDTVAAATARVAFVITGASAPHIVYPAAILSRARNRAAAERFLSFLRGPGATAIFARFRFVPLAPLR